MEITFTEQDLNSVLQPAYELYEGDQPRRDQILSIVFALGDKLVEKHGVTREERKAFIHRLIGYKGGK